MLSRSVMSDSLQPCGLQSARLLCPWGSPDKNNAVGCHAFLQGIFLTQGSHRRLLCLLHWQVGSIPLAPPGKPRVKYTFIFCCNLFGTTFYKTPLPVRLLFRNSPALLPPPASCCCSSSFNTSFRASPCPLPHPGRDGSSSWAVIRPASWHFHPVCLGWLCVSI